MRPLWKSFTRRYNLKVHKLKKHDDVSTANKQSLINDQASSVLNDENVPDQQFIVEPQQKDDEKYEQQQCNAFQVEDSVSKDFLTKRFGNNTTIYLRLKTRDHEKQNRRRCS